MNMNRVMALLVSGLLAWGVLAPASAQMAPPDYMVTVRSSLGFAETVGQLKQAIEAENLMGQTRPVWCVTFRPICPFAD